MKFITKTPKQDARNLAKQVNGELLRVARGYAVKHQDGSLSVFRNT